MQPPVSHKLTTDPTTRPPDNPALAFSQLRSSLIKVLRNSPESREPICDALELIESLQQGMEQKRNPDQKPPRDHDNPSQEYLVQQTPEGPYLAERRAGAQPFRCPKEVYDAAAKLIAQANAPLHFDDLQSKLNQSTGQRQADYRLRVCLRFWVHRDLLIRARTRYHPANPQTFEQEAQNAWTTLT